MDGGTVTERSVAKSKYKPQTFILSLPKGRGRTQTPTPVTYLWPSNRGEW